jgi:Ca2+-transporting ATPase
MREKMRRLKTVMISLETIKQPFWSMGAEETFQTLASSPEGISDEEAAARRMIWGTNNLPEPRRIGKLALIFSQLQSPLIFLLIAAGVLTVFLGEWVETGVILFTILANAALGFWQENKAEEAIEFLKSYIRVRVRVRRGGKEKSEDALILVPGDIIRLSQGDRVPADARIISASCLFTDEAVLTGESLPEEKGQKAVSLSTPLAERSCMVYSGTLVVEGSAEAVVTATGSGTEFGRIASLLEGGRREITPLGRSVARFSLWAGMVFGLVAIVLFAFGIATGYRPFEMFLIAVAVAVSAVPEGLPIALTVILAVGVLRLAKEKGVVRRLLAAETLGRTSIILTDKTGTLTQAQMELVAVLPFTRGHWGGTKDQEVRLLSEALANVDAVIDNPNDGTGRQRISGRPVEVALVRGALRRGVPVAEYFAKRPLDTLPFSSVHKFSAAVSGKDNHYTLTLFGAPDILVSFSTLPGSERDTVCAEVERRAVSGERVLALASKEIGASWREDGTLSGKKEWKDFVFRGIFSFRDPVRPGVGDAIRRIAERGVRTVIVTGDHRGTAEAVARELGLVDGAGAVMTGDDLRRLEPETVRARLNAVTVFARVTPEEKLLLVELYRGKGEVVAVTGDGVNDAPALEAADIGVAVGSGTDVAKQAADLILLENNFETLVASIEEGRRILDNIRKVVVYVLSNALDELCLIGGSLLAGLALPLNALQILFVNFFSDSFPAVSFAFEKGVDETGPKPRTLSKNLFDAPMNFFIFVIGISTSILLFLVYFFLLRAGFDPATVRTFIFASFATYTLLLSFSLRSLEKSFFSYNPFSNVHLTASVGIGFLLTAAVLYVPFLQRIFGTVSLGPLWLLGVFSVGAANILAIEAGKIAIRLSAPHASRLRNFARNFLGLFLVLFGIVAFFLPLVPFAWLAIVGFQILGVRLALWDRISSFFSKRM